VRFFPCFCFIFLRPPCERSNLILAGVAINVIAFSGTSLALNLTKDPYAVLDIVFLADGFARGPEFHPCVAGIAVHSVGWGLLFWDRRALDALSLGEKQRRV